MATYRRKCHDWRLFIAATTPGAPASQVCAQVRPDTPMSSGAAPPLGTLKVAIRDTKPPRSL